MCALLVFAMVFIPAGAVCHAGASVDLLQQMLGFEPPVPPQTLWSAINTQQYVYVKGGEVYADFAGLPDFKHFAWLAPRYIVEYPTVSRDFWYLGHRNITYTYRSKIISYITADTDAVKRYKDTVKAVGFKQMNEIKSDYFEDYFADIRFELLYDPEFILDRDGVFLTEDYDTFRLLLIGNSVTADAFGTIWECVELRFYSLSRSPGDSLDLIAVAGTLSDSELYPTAMSSGSFPTPNAALDIGNITAVSTGHLTTPNAAGDVRSVFPAPPASYLTPGALGDVREIPAANVTGLFTSPTDIN